MSPSDRIQSYSRPAIAAETYYTWQETLNGPPKLGQMVDLLSRARADGVPEDASIQLSAPCVYLHWTRPE